MLSKFSRTALITAALLAAAICVLFSFPALGESVKLSGNHAKALRYVKENQPMEASAEGVSWSPKQLLEIREALPEGAVFHFSTSWNKVKFSDTSETLDLNSAPDGFRTSVNLERILALCPNIREIDSSRKTTPSNDVVIPLMAEHPEIHFEWVVHLGGEHYCSTKATAYSTLNHTDGGWRLTTEQMELFQYIPGLKALDVGHNCFKNLDFLRYLPELELLIITNNDAVADLTMVGTLEHLKYLEVFETQVEDLSPLANCRELLDLNISSTLVTDLSPLDGITTLERLWANVLKKLPQGEKERFVQLHPDCDANFTGTSAISGSWRSHERYYHFRKCFKYKKWVPFGQPFTKD